MKGCLLSCVGQTQKLKCAYLKGFTVTPRLIEANLIYF